MRRPGWRSSRAAAAIWWGVLAAAVTARVLYCQSMSRRLAEFPDRLPRAAEGYSALAAVEGTVWALLLVLLPAASPFAGFLQVGLTLAVLLGSLLFRDKRSEQMWPEVYARQNTGILVSKAASH